VKKKTASFSQKSITKSDLLTRLKLNVSGSRNYVLQKCFDVLVMQYENIILLAFVEKYDSCSIL
jgi:hypothetical protein